MHSTPLDQAIASQTRALREAAGASRDNLARACQRVGLPWDARRVANFEQGIVAASLPVMLHLAVALSEISDSAVTLADLIPTSGAVELSPGRAADAGGVITGEALRSALRGGEVELVPAIGTIADPTLAPGWGKADDKLVADLGLSPAEVRAATQELYGHTATRERDARAGEGATPQKAGRVTRVILAEIAELLGR